VEPFELAMRVPPDERSVRLGRRFLAHALLLFGHDELEPTASLLVSELLGNAVRYATSEVQLAISGVPGGIRVDVCDDGPGKPHLDDSGPVAEQGHGLQVVDRLADRWDIEIEAQTKTVWFELRTPAAVGSMSLRGY
jgi:anti-sigma regulatory factor (Ser/Thr protein kinase)